MNEVIFFSSFLVFIAFVLMLDLGVFSKSNHTVSFKESILMTSIWVALALGFFIFLKVSGNIIHGVDSIALIQEKINLFQHPIDITGLAVEDAISLYNQNLSLEYITGYLIEYSLSVDNIFVIILIFTGFNVNSILYKRVLFWGIIGAVVMRFIFIFLSSALIQQFAWILYVFGGLLIFTGVKMFLNRNHDEKIDTQNHPIVKLLSKYFAVFPKYVKHYFFIRKNKKLFITPLFIVLIVIEFTDLIFAVDSVPAIFSITKDPYIVFFSNIFAILGLRSLFFLVINVVDLFHYLKIGLSVLLTFIGTKMIFHHWLSEIGFTTSHSLLIILGILSISIIASIVFPKKAHELNN